LQSPVCNEIFIVPTPSIPTQSQETGSKWNQRYNNWHKNNHIECDDYLKDKKHLNTFKIIDKTPSTSFSNNSGASLIYYEKKNK
jgi:hypothetical protein